MAAGGRTRGTRGRSRDRRRRVMLRMRWCSQCRCTGEKWLREKSRWSWWLWWIVWWGKMALRPRRNGFCSKQSKQVAAMPIPTTPTPTTWPMSSLWNWRTGTARWARAFPSRRSNQSKRWYGCGEATQQRKHAQSVSTISKNTKNSRNCRSVHMNTTPNALTSGLRTRSGAPFATNRLSEEEHCVNEANYIVEISKLMLNFAQNRKHYRFIKVQLFHIWYDSTKVIHLYWKIYNKSRWFVFNL